MDYKAIEEQSRAMYEELEALLTDLTKMALPQDNAASTPVASPAASPPAATPVVRRSPWNHEAILRKSVARAAEFDAIARQFETEVRKRHENATPASDEERDEIITPVPASMVRSGSARASGKGLPVQTRPATGIRSLAHETDRITKPRRKETAGLGQATIARLQQTSHGMTSTSSLRRSTPGVLDDTTATEWASSVIIEGQAMDGEELVVLTEAELPAIVVDQARTHLRELDTASTTWRTKTWDKKCARTAVKSGATSFKWTTEKSLSACQTCSNTRELCLRWFPDTATLRVVALSTSTFDGEVPGLSSTGRWTRDEAADTRIKTPKNIWR